MALLTTFVGAPDFNRPIHCEHRLHAAVLRYTLPSGMLTRQHTKEPVSATLNYRDIIAQNEAENHARIIVSVDNTHWDYQHRLRLLPLFRRPVGGLAFACFINKTVPVVGDSKDHVSAYANHYLEHYLQQKNTAQNPKIERPTESKWVHHSTDWLHYTLPVYADALGSIHYKDYITPLNEDYMLTLRFTVSFSHDEKYGIYAKANNQRAIEFILNSLNINLG